MPDLKIGEQLVRQNGKPLGDLLQGVHHEVIQAGELALGETGITMVSDDSREVREGALFVAVAGGQADGHNYILDAVQGGCVAIVVQRNADYRVPDEWNGYVLEVEDSRRAYGAAAENFFGNPAEQMVLVGITGTNGKTTITYLLEEILENQGIRVGVIGTVNYRYTGADGKVVVPSPFTTPEAVLLQKLLYEMAQAGVEYVLMEVSSHALSQSRIGNIRYDVAAFTNLSRDHLDYHGTMEAYFEAKQILFTQHMKAEGAGVVSYPVMKGESLGWAEKLSEICHNRGMKTVRTGSEEGGTIRLLNFHSALTATGISFVADGTSFQVDSPLVGHFNVDNILTALGIVSALKLDLTKAVETIGRAKGAPGRLQRVDVDDGTEHENPVVFVDYAHTPDALKQVLSTLNSLPHRELFCVFGCGGDRDSGKRPVMGSFAGSFADVVVVTDDNPRTEDPDEIRRQIAPGVLKTGLECRERSWMKNRTCGDRGFVEIGSRREAIREAICSAGPGDIVLIAGKGHETYQLGIDGKRYFDDCMEAADALLSWNCLSIARATRGELLSTGCEGRCLGRISTDSRTVEPGDVFVALRGERFDAHQFLEAVAEKGSGCLVVEKEKCQHLPSAVPRVEVEDTLQALGDLAAFRRRLLGSGRDLVVAAITGSCGKTTVKEMAGSIFRRMWPAGQDHPEESVLMTQGNLNNLIGLPLSLLPLSVSHRAAVLEMGMNVPGEIRRMTDIAAPEICCITNIHGVHLEGLGDIDGVGSAKEELFEKAPESAVLVVNLDDEQVRGRAEKYLQKKITYSASESPLGQGPDLYASDISAADPGVITFTLHRADESEDIHLFTAGIHNVSNAVAAAAVASAAGASMQEIASGLADFRPADRRMVIETGRNGISVINDTYNANPVSMAAALETLVNLAKGRRAAVLSDMLELGEASANLHYRLGLKAGELGLDFLVVVGDHGNDVAGGALDGGMAQDQVMVCSDKNELESLLDSTLRDRDFGDKDWILVKGSRGGKMETVVEHLKQ